MIKKLLNLFGKKNKLSINADTGKIELPNIIELPTVIELPKKYFDTVAGKFYIGEKIINFNCYGYSMWKMSKYNPEASIIHPYTMHHWFDAEILRVSEDLTQMELKIGLKGPDCVRWVLITEENIKKIL